MQDNKNEGGFIVPEKFQPALDKFLKSGTAVYGDGQRVSPESYHLEVRFTCGCCVRRREALFNVDHLEITPCDMSKGCFYDLEKAKQALANPPPINCLGAFIVGGENHTVQWVEENESK